MGLDWTDFAGPSIELPVFFKLFRRALHPSPKAGYRDCAVTRPRVINIASVTASKITCKVFGRMPLRSGKKACVAPYIA